MTEFSQARADRVRFDRFEVDLVARELQRDGRRVPLQDRPFQLLVLLLEQPGREIAREELQRRLWPDGTFVDFETGLNTAVKRLRDALGDSAQSPRFIETRARHGYRFIAQVSGGGPAGESPIDTSPRLLPSGAASPSARGHAPASAVAIEGPRARDPSRRRRSWVTRAAALGGAALAVIVLALRWSSAARSSAPIQRLAVLPFANLSGDPAQDYFADGLTDELITQIAQIRALRVTSRTSSAAFKGTTKRMPEIARELGVDAVLEGSVVRVGDRVRVTAQLVRAQSDEHLWAQTYERDIRDILTLQGEVATAVALQVQARLTLRESTRLGLTRQVNPDAYDAYLRGKYISSRPGRTVREDEHASVSTEQYLRQAIATDPNFPEAYAALARFEIDDVATDGESALDLAEQHARRAVALDPDFSGGHATLGAVQRRRRDWRGAEASLRRALALDSSDADAHYLYARLLMLEQRFAEAREHAASAAALDPVGLDGLWALADVEIYSRNAAAALPYARRLVELNPNAYLPHSVLGRAYFDLGSYDEAIVEFHTMVEAEGDLDDWARLARAYAGAGQVAKAREMVPKLEDMPRRNPYMRNMVATLACLEADLGDKERAFHWLDVAVSEPGGGNLPWLNLEPCFDSLHGDPRYAGVLRSLGLPQGEAGRR